LFQINDHRMLLIKNVKNIKGETITHQVGSSRDEILDARGLTMLPALIDPHVHFRTPGHEYKEDWQSGARAAIAGGVTTVLDMPNNDPSTVTKKLLEKKKSIIDSQLKQVNIPLRYGLYLGADKNHLSEIKKAKSDIVAIKVFLGSSTGSLLIEDYNIFEKICEEAAKNDILVAVHAEDEKLLRENAKNFAGQKEPRVHSKIRFREAAIYALKKALDISKRAGNRLYILHAGTKEEVEMVREAKTQGLRVFLETTPHHLFLTENDYATLHTKAQMNPPLRTKTDQVALWKGLNDGIIDTIGTDHAPHTENEKKLPYGQAPSGVPGIETYLPLLLDAYNKNLITLENIVRLTSSTVAKIFELEPNDDIVLVNLKKTKKVLRQNLKSKSGWSPFEGRALRGWPVCTILKGKIYYA